MSQTRRSTDTQMDREPVTQASRGHAVGTGVGAVVGGVAGAAATGAAIGTIAGPVGTVAGAAVGAVVGGVAGNLIAKDINPTVEDKYWRENYAARPYAANKSYDEYGPAYRYGWESYAQHGGKRFDEVESDLERDWDGAKGKSRLQWQHAKPAARDAWDRVASRQLAHRREMILIRPLFI
jgi:hypothetical protein